MKFYWETVSKLDEKPVRGNLELLAAADCASCKLQQGHVDDLVREGSHVETRAPRTSQWAVRKDSTKDSVVIQNRYADEGCRHLIGRRVIRQYPATQTAMETRADWSNGGWRVGAIGHRTVD